MEPDARRRGGSRQPLGSDVNSPGAPYAQDVRQSLFLRSVVRRVLPKPVRQRIWLEAVDRPMLSRAYFFLAPEMRALRVTRRTELLIDGFMRSANTYAVFAFQH